MKKLPKIPTDSEYENFNGLHCSGLWRSLSNEWRCPSCKRSKRELMRWGVREGSNARDYGRVGWKTGLHRHHDHGQRWSGEVIICGDCNSADGRVKLQLGLPRDWSFTAEEIGRFVTVVPYGKFARIDLEIAKALYMEATSRGSSEP